jgi:hypothetical protein
MCRSYAEAKLSYQDMFSRRMLLSEQEISWIMASQRLFHVCVDNGIMDSMTIPISVTRIGYMAIQDITCKETFSLYCDVAEFTPEDPPAIVVITYPGSIRRPVKPWHLCSSQEKVVFIKIFTHYCITHNIIISLVLGCSGLK